MINKDRQNIKDGKIVHLLNFVHQYNQNYFLFLILVFSSNNFLVHISKHPPKINKMEYFCVEERECDYELYHFKFNDRSFKEACVF